jgi:hypothetical protein
MFSTRTSAVLAVLLLAAAACGGGGPSRDDFLDAANEVCAESNSDAEDIDAPEAFEDAIAYADDAKEVVADRILALEAVDVPSDDESDFEDYLDSLVEERDALIELSGASPEDDLTPLIEDVRDLEADNRDLADDLDLDDCGDAAEGETVALALDLEPEPEPVPDPDPVDPEPIDPQPGDGDLGDDPVAVIQSLGLPDGAEYSGDTQEITDDSGTLKMTVPVEWVDVDGSASEDGTFNLDATPDIDLFQAGFTVPGALFAATGNAIDLQELLTNFTPGACTVIGQGAYTDGVYTGSFQVATDCGGTSTAVLVVAADADDGTHTALVQIGVTSVQDIDPLNQVLQTFLATSGNFG